MSSTGAHITGHGGGLGGGVLERGQERDGSLARVYRDIKVGARKAGGKAAVTRSHHDKIVGGRYTKEEGKVRGVMKGGEGGRWHDEGRGGRAT